MALLLYDPWYNILQSTPPVRNRPDRFQVVPWYVKAEATSDDIDMYWSPAIPDGQREMEISYTFPHQFPEGIFERLSAQLQVRSTHIRILSDAPYPGYARSQYAPCFRMRLS